jgi:hypothetical protein
MESTDAVFSPRVMMQHSICVMALLALSLFGAKDSRAQPSESSEPFDAYKRLARAMYFGTNDAGFSGAMSPNKSLFLALRRNPDLRLIKAASLNATPEGRLWFACLDHSLHKDTSTPVSLFGLNGNEPVQVLRSSGFFTSTSAEVAKTIQLDPVCNKQGS